MDMTVLSALLAMLVLAAIAVRVHFDPAHRSRTQRVAWAAFSGVLPLIGYPAFPVYRYSRSLRPSQALVR